jgi:hypothetical protein
MDISGKTTATGNAYFGSEQQELDGISASALHVSLGYHLNSLETEIEHVFVSQTVETAVVWKYEIDPPEAGGVLAFTLPQRPSAGGSRVVGRVPDHDAADSGLRDD